MKLLKREKKKPKTEQTLILNEALEKLTELNIAIITAEGKYKYSRSFEGTVKHIKLHPPGRLKQMKYGSEARKLIPQLLASVVTKPSRRDLENIITAYVCLKVHIKRNKLKVDKSIIQDLAYALWFLNDNKPTVEEVKEWKLTSQT